jgi:hypothetical protein
VAFVGRWTDFLLIFFIVVFPLCTQFKINVRRYKRKENACGFCKINTHMFNKHAKNVSFVGEKRKPDHVTQTLGALLRV